MITKAPVESRRSLVTQALAFAVHLPKLQASRIRSELATEAAAQLDLADLIPAILNSTPPRRESIAVEAGIRAFPGAEVARENHQDAARTHSLHLASELATAAVAHSSDLASDDDRESLSRLCAYIGDLGAGKTVADSIGDPAKKVAAYITLIAFTPPKLTSVSSKQVTTGGQK